jgi:hypothetical protein
VEVHVTIAEVVACLDQSGRGGFVEQPMLVQAALGLEPDEAGCRVVTEETL